MGNGQSYGAGETRVGQRRGEEKQYDHGSNEWCMGNMTGSKIVGVCWAAVVMALPEAMDDNRLYHWIATYVHT